MAATRHEPFDDQLAVPPHALGVGQHLDAVRCRVVAGRHHADPLARPHLDRTDAAYAVRLQDRVMTQGGDLDSQFFGNGQHRRSVIGRGFDSVDLELDGFHAA